jgi:hypothetical protein
MGEHHVHEQLPADLWVKISHWGEGEIHGTSIRYKFMGKGQAGGRGSKRKELLERL